VDWLSAPAMSAEKLYSTAINSCFALPKEIFILANDTSLAYFWQKNSLSD
jgi:hypothetical protein